MSVLSAGLVPRSRPIGGLELTTLLPVRQTRHSRAKTRVQKKGLKDGTRTAS